MVVVGLVSAMRFKMARQTRSCDDVVVMNAAFESNENEIATADAAEVDGTASADLSAQAVMAM